MNGEVRITGDVAGDFARLVRDELASAKSAGRLSVTHPFRLGCSGGSSGVACISRLSAQDDLAWDLIACLFADERCVDPSSSDANQATVGAALGAHRDRLAGFFPMDCTKGPQAYEDVLRANPIDLLQLGLGPDAHTASLFPSSPALNAPANRLVVPNTDPSGRNQYPRMTMTYAAIAAVPIVVVTVMGKEKAPAMRSIALGEDVPAANLHAGRLIWLCDLESASDLPAGLGR